MLPPRRQPTNQHHQRNLAQNKWPKWWLQSFLAGVETLVLGARDDAGMVTDVRALGL